MKRILIIDDDITITQVFEQFFTNQGYRVDCAQDGREGLRLVQENAPSLIITDILMPEMDGLEVLIQLRNLHESVPVIAISGGMHAHPASFLRHAQLFGASKVFAKPVGLEELLVAVEEHLDDS